MIYLLMAGRIGNQLFMYAAVRTMQYLRGDTEEIIIDDRMLGSGIYENSLQYYPLENVKFVHDDKILSTMRFWKQRLGIKIIKKLEWRKDTIKRSKFECKHQKLINKMGLIYCEDGLENYSINQGKDLVVWGYFQSEKYFLPCRNEIIEKYSLKEKVEKSDYPNLEQIRKRNSVCISIKIEHNIGTEMYDVCSNGYWEKAIKYIMEHVSDPLFFVCSDNIKYVREHLIDFNKYDVITQDPSYPVHISLAVMAQCKHFIIGNTSYGWWAQYLSQYPDKIVVAPSRWYGIDVACDIYQDNWHTIEV